MRLVYLHKSEISNSERRELVSNIVTALELVPEKALVAIRDSLENHEVMDSGKIKKITGLDGQGLDSVLLLFNNAAMGTDVLLVAIDTALAVVQTVKRSSEIIDLSWTGPVQFSVEGRTTPSVMEEMILNAKDSIIITGYSITDDAENFIRLLENAIDKVEVIFVIHSDDKSNNFEILANLWKKEKKPKVYSRTPGPLDVYFKIHAKMLVVDNFDLLVTSANLTWHGMSNNFEVGLRVRGNTAKKAEALIRNLIERNYLEVVNI